MKLLRLAMLAAVSAAAIGVPALAGHSWGNYHWKRTTEQITPPIRTALADPSKWREYVNRAVADWNGGHSDFPDRIESPYDPVENSGGNPKSCKVNTGEILVCATRYGDNGWLGLAQIWTSGGHIVKGTTKLNDTYFDRPYYDTPAWRRLVTCQEIGHDYGLGHTDEKFDNPNHGTCMDYTSDPDGTKADPDQLSNEYPNRHDFEQLAKIYEHSYASTSTNFGVREAGKGAVQADSDGVGGNSPAEWGRAVDRDGYGRPHIFVQDLPGGGKKITHVFWTLEHNRAGEHH